jgi:hypothetical protein
LVTNRILSISTMAMGMFLTMTSLRATKPRILLLAVHEYLADRDCARF